MMNVMKKGIVLPLLLLLASVSLIIGAFFLLDNEPKTPTQTATPVPVIDTTDWKTYTNKELGFSFKYPQDAKYSIDPNVKNGIQIWLEVPNNFTFYITTVPNSKKLSLDNPQQLFNNGPFTADLGNAILTQTDLGGLKAYKADNCCINHEFNFWALTEIATIKNQYVYEIRVESKEHTKQYPSNVDRKLLDQILSTFKFTDQSQTADTSSWKTYTNSKLGYSLKYPPNLNLEERVITSPSTISDELLTRIKQTPQVEYISISVESNPKNLTAFEWAKNEFNETRLVTDDMLKPFSIDGTAAIRSTEIPAQSAEDHVFFQKNGKIYWFTLGGAYTDKNGLTTELFDQILSTLKFTNQ